MQWYALKIFLVWRHGSAVKSASCGGLGFDSHMGAYNHCKSNSEALMSSSTDTRDTYGP